MLYARRREIVQQFEIKDRLASRSVAKLKCRAMYVANSHAGRCMRQTYMQGGACGKLTCRAVHAATLTCRAVRLHGWGGEGIQKECLSL